MTETTSGRDTLRFKRCFFYITLVVVIVIVYTASNSHVTMIHSMLGSTINVTNNHINTETEFPGLVNDDVTVASGNSTHTMSTATYPGTLADLGPRWIEEKGYSGFLKDLKVATYTPNVTSEPVRLEPLVVADVETTLLVYVYSTITHFKPRQRVRETWGNPRVYENMTHSNLRPTVIFVLAQPWGNPDYDVIMRDVTEESLRYGDIILFDIGEHYNNLTLKGLATMNWVLETFTHLHLFLKTDDDLMIDLFLWIHQVEHQNVLFSDQVAIYTVKVCGRSSPQRRGRWAVTFEEYPHARYPPYCTGHGYLLTRPAIQRLLSVLPYVHLLRMEDVFLTGILAEKAHVSRIRFNSDNYSLSLMVDCKNLEVCEEFWRDIQEEYHVQTNAMD